MISPPVFGPMGFGSVDQFDRRGCCYSLAGQILRQFGFPPGDNEGNRCILPPISTRCRVRDCCHETRRRRGRTFQKKEKKNKQTKEEKEDGEKRHADFPTRSLNPTPGTNIEAPRVKSVLRQTWTPHLISLLLLLP